MPVLCMNCDLNFYIEIIAQIWMSSLVCDNAHSRSIENWKKINTKSRYIYHHHTDGVSYTDIHDSY